jgi:glycosyltransferase involved in cell wall biosynthesis
MRVTFLTHYYPPEIGAPQARISTLARLLAERGVSVTVHTGFPHYPDGHVKPPYRVRPWLVEAEAPVRLVRSAVYPAPNRGFGRRLAGHLSFAGSALATARVAGPADVVVGESPPLFVGAATIPYARLAGAAAVLNIADRWPASAVELGVIRSRSAIRAAERLERASYRRAAAITVPTEGLAGDIGQLPEAGGKVVRLGPAVDTHRFRPLPAPAGDGPLRILYAGTIGLAQGVGTLLEAARIAGPEVELHIAGDGAEAADLRDRLRRNPAANVRLLGAVPHEQVPGLYGDVDAAAVLLRDRPVFESALPTKLLEAMAAGRPVLLSASGESERLVEAAEAGLVVPPGDAVALADAMRRLRSATSSSLGALGAAGRSYVERNFGWDSAAAQWQDLLERVAAQEPNSP